MWLAADRKGPGIPGKGSQLVPRPGLVCDVHDLTRPAPGAYCPLSGSVSQPQDPAWVSAQRSSYEKRPPPGWCSAGHGRRLCVSVHITSVTSVEHTCYATCTVPHRTMGVVQQGLSQFSTHH